MAALGVETDMSIEAQPKPDFRMPTRLRMAPRAVADGGGGTIIAVADLDAPPERIFRALTTNEVEQWWGAAAFYRQTQWKADVRICGPWSAVVIMADGH